MTPITLHGRLGPTFRSLLGKQKHLEVALLGQGSLHLMVKNLAQGSKGGLLSWIKRQFFKPITIVDEDTGEQKRVLVNTFDTVQKLHGLGLSRLSVYKALCCDTLTQLLVEQKTQEIISTLPPGSVQSEHLRQALKWVNDNYFKPELSRQSYPMGNPIGIDINHDNCVLKIQGYEIDLKDVIQKVNKTALKKEGFSDAKIILISNFFEQHVKHIRAHFKKHSQPLELNHPVLKHVIILSPSEILIEQKKLGSGSFKEVKKVCDIFSGQSLAGYFINYHKAHINQDTKTCLQEVDYLHSLSGQKGLVKLKKTKFLETSQTAEAGIIRLGVFMKLYNLGDLNKAMTSRSLKETDKYDIAKDLAKALRLLHQKGLIHRDIKPANILLKNSKLSKVKAVFSDLGSLAKPSQLEPKSLHATTEWYVSPEYAQALRTKNGPALKSSISFDLDVWSLGVVFYELFHGQLPPWLQSSTSVNLHDTASILRSISEITFPISYPSEHPVNAVLNKMLTTSGYRADMGEIIAMLESI